MTLEYGDICPRCRHTYDAKHTDKECLRLRELDRIEGLGLYPLEYLATPTTLKDIQSLGFRAEVARTNYQDGELVRVIYVERHATQFFMNVGTLWACMALQDPELDTRVRAIHHLGGDPAVMSYAAHLLAEYSRTRRPSR